MIPPGVLGSARANTDGLGFASPDILHLDPGIAQSYPGSGPTWMDLSQGAVGSLHRTERTDYQYSSAHGGKIGFTGGWAQFPSLPGYDIQSPTTIAMWVYPTGNNESALIERGYYSGVGGWMLWYIGGGLHLYIRKGSKLNVALPVASWSFVTATIGGPGEGLTLEIRGGATASRADVNYTSFPGTLANTVLNIAKYGSGFNGRIQVAQVGMFSGVMPVGDREALYQLTKSRYGL